MIGMSMLHFFGLKFMPTSVTGRVGDLRPAKELRLESDVVEPSATKNPPSLCEASFMASHEP